MLTVQQVAREFAVFNNMVDSDDEDELECIDSETYDDNVFTLDGEEWLILDDSDADERLAAYVADSLWAFNVDFIARHVSVTLSTHAKGALQKMQEQLCEDANPLIAAMLGAESEDADDEAISEFALAAAAADGRGHFLSPYDGEEVEFTDSEGVMWYAYRLN